MPAASGRRSRRRDGWLNEAIVTLLRRSGTPLGAHRITDRLRLDSGPIFHSQVFRALDHLRTAGLIRKIETTRGYTMRGEQAITLLCTGCGSVGEAEGSSVTARLAELAGAASFVPHDYILEVAGSCARCRGDAGRAPQS